MTRGRHSYRNTFVRCDKKGTSAPYKLFSSRNRNLFETFKRRFEQAIQQVESYSMDAILQNFRRNFGSPTPFFQSLYLDPPKTMEELYRWADKYLMLEDNVCAATQTVMITSQPTEGHKPSRKKLSKSKERQSRYRKRSRDQSQKKESPHSSPP